jgi:dolichol-phosphate mannosyltransferase
MPTSSIPPGDATPAASAQRILLGLPAYNEEIALPRLLERVVRLRESAGADLTVVLYNDGSTDRTVPIAEEWKSRLPLVVIDGVQNKGLGAGLRALVEYAAAHGDDGDVLVIMDCDDTHDPAQILQMLDALERGADLVIASRYTRGSLVQGVPLFRRLTALGALMLFKLIHPIRGVWDYTCGYRAYRVSALKAASRRYASGLVRERGFACMVELLLKLNALGLRMAEIPLQLRYDQKPTESKMGVSSNIRRLLKLLIGWRVSGFDT